MDEKFKLDKSLYIMMVFIGFIGFLLVFVRSDFVLQNNFFSNKNEKPIQYAASKEMENFKAPVYLIITGDDGKQFYPQLKDRLEKMGKTIETIPVEQFEGVKGDFEGVITATEQLDSVKNPQSLLTYIEDGGRIFFAMRPSPGNFLSSVYQQLGMTETGSFIETTGLEFSEPVFKTDETRLFEAKEIVNSSLQVRLSPSAQLELSSGEGVPLLWRTEYGKGRVVFFNGTLLAQPEGSGLLVRGMQLLSSELIYPVVNATSTLLRGFPFPMPEGSYADGKQTIDDFYRHIFWPEMLRIEAKHDLNYTSSFFADAGEFKAKELSKDQENLLLYGRDLLRLGGEIGIEGYGSHAEEAYQEVFRRIEHALPGYKVQSFMPSIDRDFNDHMDVFSQSFNELSVVLGTNEEGIYITQEGQPSKLAGETSSGENHEGANKQDQAITENASGEVVMLPETFSGFSPDSYSKWLIVNSLLTDGYFSQSIAPQVLMSGDNVGEMLAKFDQFAGEIDRELPWLERSTLSEAAANAIHASRQFVFSEKVGNEWMFHVNEVSSPSYFFFYTDQKIKRLKDCEVVKIGHRLFLVKSSKLSFSIGLEG